MALPKKKKVTKESLIDEDAFNKFCLTYTDYQGEPLMYLDGTQYFMNMKHSGPAKDAIAAFAKYMTIK